MKILEHRIPPPLVGLACAIAMWGLARFAPVIAISDALRYALAFGFGLLGIAIALSGVVSFRRARTTVNPLKPEAASELVTAGIYRYTRNPMYLGMLLVLVGWAAFLASPRALLGAVAFACFIDRFQIRPEERALHAVFGESFTAYTARVRRWL